MGAFMFGPGIFELVGVCAYHFTMVHRQYVPPPSTYMILL